MKRLILVLGVGWLGLGQASDEFKSKLPMSLTVVSNPCQQAIFKKNGRITGTGETAQGVYGYWKIKKGKLIADYLIIYRQEDGRPCSNETKTNIYGSLEACYHKHKVRTVYTIGKKGKKLTVNGISPKKQKGRTHIEIEKFCE